MAIHNALQTSAGMIVPFFVGQLIAWNANSISLGFEWAISGFGLATLICAMVGLWMVKPETTRLELQALSIGHHLDCEPRQLINA